MNQITADHFLLVDGSRSFFTQGDNPLHSSEVQDRLLRPEDVDFNSGQVVKSSIADFLQRGLSDTSTSSPVQSPIDRHQSAWEKSDDYGLDFGNIESSPASDFATSHFKKQYDFVQANTPLQ